MAIPLVYPILSTGIAPVLLIVLFLSLIPCYKTTLWTKEKKTINKHRGVIQ